MSNVPNIPNCPHADTDRVGCDEIFCYDCKRIATVRDLALGAPDAWKLLQPSKPIAYEPIPPQTKVTRIMGALDALLNETYKSLNELCQLGIEDQSLLDICDALRGRENTVGSIQTKLRNLVNTIELERYFRWSTQERFYVYASFRFGKPVEASLHALDDVAGSSWHSLPLAARHWQRMEGIHSDNRRSKQRNREEIHFAVMAYDPVLGRIRKVGQDEIDGALGKTEHV